MPLIIIFEIICAFLFPCYSFAQMFSIDPITITNETTTDITLCADDSINLTQYLWNNKPRISIQMDNAYQTAIVDYGNQIQDVCDIQIQDNLAYIAGGNNGLMILDIELPHIPKQLSQCNIPGRANLITLNQSMAFIADKDKGFYIIDLSELSSPEYMKKVNTSGTVLDMLVYDQMLIIADSNAGLLIYDIPSLDESPQIVQTFPLNGSIKAIALDHHTLYFVDYFSGIYTMEFESEEPLVFEKNLDIAYIDSILVSPQYLFIAKSDQGILIIDRTSLDTLWTIKTPGNVNHIYSKDHIIYASDTIAGFHVILFNSVQAPHIIATINTKESASTFAINGQFAYISDLSKQLQIVDLHNMYTPKSIYSITATDKIYDTVYFDNKLFVADGKEGIKIYQPMSAPQWMTKMVHIDTPGNANRIIVNSDIIMVADGDKGVQVIKNNSENYDFSETINTQGYANDIKMKSSYAFVSNMTEQVKVFNIEYVSNPVMKTPISCTGMAMSLCLSQNKLIISEGEMGIEIFNVEDPENVQFMQRIDTEGFAFQTVMTHQAIIVADGSAGLQIFQRKNDQEFTHLKTIESQFSAQKIALYDNDIYVIDSRGEVHIYEISHDLSITLKNHINVGASVHTLVKHDDNLFLADSIGIYTLPMPYDVQKVKILDQSHASLKLPQLKHQGLYRLKIIRNEHVDSVYGYIKVTSQLKKESPGVAIIVGGGQFSINNRYAKMTLKLTTQMYQDLKSLGFDDGSIYWLINSNMVDINYDGHCDKVVDDSYPNVEAFLNLLDHPKMNALDKTYPLFIYLQGGNPEKKQFEIQNSLDHLNPDDLASTLDQIQSQTGCTIIVLLEFSYAGAFMKKLSNHNRIT